MHAIECEGLNLRVENPLSFFFLFVPVALSDVYLDDCRCVCVCFLLLEMVIFQYFNLVTQNG